MAADVVLGIDVGTSGLKVVALSGDGAVVGEGESGYPVASPEPGRAESDVAVWRQAVDDVLDRLDLTGRRVLALGLAGQMHGAVLVDAAGRPLAPALLWPDSRATAELARWRALGEPDRAALANPLVPGMTGPLLGWLAAHRRDLVERAAAVLLPKDALRAALVPGSPLVTDRSDASATLLWDVPGDRWSAAAVRAAGVAPELMPAVRPSSEVVAELCRAQARFPVVVGGADTPLAMLAVGATGLQVNLGTGAQVLRPGAQPVAAADPVTHLYADVDDGWYAMAALQNGGSAWAWVAGMLGVPEAQLFELAASAPAGAGGVRFAPWLTGERGGVAGPDDRAAFTGLSAGTTRADLARAAVEGVVQAIGRATRLLGEGGHGGEGEVVLTGGGGRASVVRRLLADELGRPVTWRPLRSASATGAAMLAARGIGLELSPTS
jgi:xylulokinase